MKHDYIYTGNIQILTQTLSFSRRRWSLHHPEGGLSVATGALVLQRHVVLCLTSDWAQCLHQGDFLCMLVSRHFKFFQADTHVILLPAEKPLSAAAGTNTTPGNPTPASLISWLSGRASTLTSDRAPQSHLMTTIRRIFASLRVF